MSDSMDQLYRIEVLENKLTHERAAKETAVAVSQHVLHSLSNLLDKLSSIKVGENVDSDVSCVPDVEALQELIIGSLTDENIILKSLLKDAGEDGDGDGTSYQYSSSRWHPDEFRNTSAEYPGSPSNGDKSSMFELNSDLHEIDRVDLENVLPSSDDEEIQANLESTLENERRRSTLSNTSGEALSDDLDLGYPTARQQTADTVQDEGRALNTVPAPGVLRVGSGARGVSAGEYNIPSKEEIELAILADINQKKHKDAPSNLYPSQYRRERWAVEDPYSPMYWTYGISYQVDPAGRSTFRTIHIGNIGNGVSLEHVLEYVRGGKIVSAVLLDTTVTHRAMSVLVIFVHASDAAAYVAFVRENPIRVGGKKIEVTLVCSATYPMNRTLANAVVHHQTRCVRVRNYPANGVPVPSLKHDLRLWGPLNIPSTTHMFIDDDGTLQIRCSSIVAASRIFSLWQSHPAYRALGIEFGPDPCAGSFDELLERCASDRGNPWSTFYSSGEGSSRLYSIPEAPPRHIPSTNPDEIHLSDGSEDGYVPPARPSTPETIQIYMRQQDMAPSIATAEAVVTSQSPSRGSRASIAGEVIGQVESGPSAFQTHVPERLALSSGVHEQSSGPEVPVQTTYIPNLAGLVLALKDMAVGRLGKNRGSLGKSDNAADMDGANVIGEVVVNTKADANTIQAEVDTISHKEFAADTKIDIGTEDVVQAEVDVIAGKESAVEAKTDIDQTGTTATGVSDAAIETSTYVETAGEVEVDEEAGT